MTTELRMTGSGSPELVRPDGWVYPLSGIGCIELTSSYEDYRAELRVEIYDVSDKTLQSVRALRDEYPNLTLHIETKTY